MFVLAAGSARLPAMKISLIRESAQRVLMELPGINLNAEADELGEINELLSWLFRQFNRADGSELITVAKYPIYSLSVGDVIDLDGRKFRCEFAGWREVM